MQRGQHGRCEAAERPNKKVGTIALRSHSHSVFVEATDKISNHFVKDLMVLCDLEFLLSQSNL